jgi:hypothetical protein
MQIAEQQPAELAPIFVFLASDQATYVTGEVYGATGGPDAALIIFKGKIFDQLRGLLGEACGKAMQEIVQNANTKPATGVKAALIGPVRLLYLGKSGVDSSYGDPSLCCSYGFVTPHKSSFSERELTHVYATRFGSHVAPANSALAVPRHA